MPTRALAPVFLLLLTIVLLGCGSTQRSISASATSVFYVVNQNLETISIFQVNTTGQLSLSNSVSTGPCRGPRYLEPHSSQMFVFVSCQGSNAVASFAVNPMTGNLSMIGSPVPAGSSPTTVAVHPSGNFVYASNLFSNNISAFRVGLDGSLSEIAGSPFAAGSTPYWVEMSDSGQFVYAANRDSNDVNAYRVDPQSGALTQIPGSPFPADRGARAVVLTGKFAFVPNRIANTVSAFTVDSATGTLTPVPGSPFPTGTDPRTGTADPSGRFLYVANTISNNISAYAIDQNTGALTPLEGSPFPAGQVALQTELDKTGKLIYVANDGSAVGGSNNVMVFAIDSASGRLSSVQTVATPGAAVSFAQVSLSPTMPPQM